GLMLAPFVVPYAQNRRELGMERALRQPPKHSADVLTYAETGVAQLYHFAPTGHIAETSLFMGFFALFLAGAGCVLAPAPPAPAPAGPAGRGRLRRGLVAAMAAAGAGLVVSLGWRAAWPESGGRIPEPQVFLYALLLLVALRIGLLGWRAARAGERRGPLGERELGWVCVFLSGLFFGLSLGPGIYVAKHDVGSGLYGHLYRYLVPLHAMRITSRIGVVVVLAVSLLAGLGLKRLLVPLPRGRAVAVTIGAAFVLLAEY